MENYKNSGSCATCGEVVSQLQIHQRQCKIKNQNPKQEVDYPFGSRVVLKNRLNEDSSTLTTALYTL